MENIKFDLIIRYISLISAFRWCIGVKVCYFTRDKANLNRSWCHEKMFYTFILFMEIDEELLSKDWT